MGEGCCTQPYPCICKEVVSGFECVGTPLWKMLKFQRHKSYWEANITEKSWLETNAKYFSKQEVGRINDEM